MKSRPGLIRAILKDTLAIVAIFAITAVPLFAQEQPICYMATGEGCAWVLENENRPYMLIEFPGDGGFNVLNVLADLDACAVAAAEARAEAVAALATGTDYSCRIH